MASRFYLAILIFPRIDFDKVTNVLFELKITWREIDMRDCICPPAYLTKSLGRINQLVCVVLDSKDDLVEELMSVFRGEIEVYHLYHMMFALAKQGIEFYIGFTTTSGNRTWREIRTSTGGLSTLEVRITGHNPQCPVGEFLPDVGVLVKPYNDRWETY